MKFPSKEGKHSTIELTPKLDKGFGCRRRGRKNQQYGCDINCKVRLNINSFIKKLKNR